MNDENCFVNLYTGEVIDKRDYIERDAIQRKKEGFKRYLSKGKRSPFYWGDIVNISRFLNHNKNTLTFLGAILILGCYINNDDTLLCKADREKTPYKREEIRHLLGMKKTTFKNFIKDSKSLGILIVEGCGKNAIYRLNREYHFIGRQEEKHKTREMVRIYKEGIMAMFKSNLKLDDIGFLYLILPYVDYNNCTIVDDPFVDIPTPLSYKEICEKLGFTRPTLNKYLTMSFEYDFGKNGNVSRHKLRVFGKFDAGKKVFCINPIILRRCATQRGIIEYSQLDKIFKITGTKI